MSETPSGDTFTWQDVQDLVKQAREESDAAHNAEVESLRAALSGVAASPIPAHSGGEGTDVAQTWSKAEQEASVAKANAVP